MVKNNNAPYRTVRTTPAALIATNVPKGSTEILPRLRVASPAPARRPRGTTPSPAKSTTTGNSRAAANQATKEPRAISKSRKPNAQTGDKFTSCPPRLLSYSFVAFDFVFEHISTALVLSVLGKRRKAYSG